MEANNTSGGAAAPLCEYFGKCGGCKMQDLPIEKQHEKKVAQVIELLSESYGKPKCKDSEGSWDFPGISESPLNYGYRNKMEYSFGDERKDGPLALGLHKQRSFYDIVDLNECLISPSDMNLIRCAVRDYFAAYYERGEIDYVRKKNHVGYLRHLLLRRAENTGEILVCLVTATAGRSAKLKAEAEASVIEGFISAVLSLEGQLKGHIAGICQIYNDSLSDAVKCDELRVLYGRDHIYEEICGLRFKISVFSFFQTNSLGAEVLYKKATDYAASVMPETKPVIYDLYSGTGTIAQLISGAASQVYGIEIVEEAVDAARENAKLNGIENVTFIAGDVLKIICGEEGEALPRPDLIILDPPREGVNARALSKILSYGCENIIYISCKAKSLAAELFAFKEAGYRLVKAECVDMFPHTGNIEVVVLLSRA